MLAPFLDDPLGHHLVCESIPQANSTRNDLSIPLKAFVFGNWEDEGIVLDKQKAFRLNAEYVFYVHTDNSICLVSMKPRGLPLKKTKILKKSSGSPDAFDASNERLFEAACMCLEHEMFSEPLSWYGDATDWHKVIATKHKLEILVDEDNDGFRLF